MVVLQEDLPETTVQDFSEHARLFVAEARKAGVRPVLLMAWAYDRLGWITMDEIAPVGLAYVPADIAAEDAVSSERRLDALQSYQN